jgi:hypothetical protein
MNNEDFYNYRLGFVWFFVGRRRKSLYFKEIIHWESLVKK